ncbi:MAG: hypothetical protein H6845_00635 [Alphaproteobacteria bacterium]|nr:MAG: hypothetical protein H6845_00635 [Alphaproteobacteria bacterium]
MQWTCGRSRKLKKNINLECDKNILELTDITSLLSKTNRNVLDIGFGSGDSVLADLEHGSHVLGCEIFKPAVYETLDKILKFGYDLSKSHFYIGFVDELLKFLKTPVFAEVKMLFPDPWHKNKHSKRRFYNIPYFDLLIFRVLCNKGRFVFASDIEYMYVNARKLFLSQLFTIEDAIFDAYEACPYRTAYCKKGFEAGRKVYSMVATKI